LNWGLRPQTPNILLTGNPGTTNIHIENLQINLNMGNATNVNGVPIEERIKALRDAFALELVNFSLFAVTSRALA
jgi:hypothetical protein